MNYIWPSWLWLYLSKSLKHDCTASNYGALESNSLKVVLRIEPMTTAAITKWSPISLTLLILQRRFNEHCDATYWEGPN